MQQHYDLLPLELVSYRNTAEDYEKDNKCLLSLAAESKRFLQDTNVQMTNTCSDDNNIYIVNKPSNSDDKKSMPIIDSSPVLEKISLGKHLLSMWYLAVILLTPIVFLPVFLLVSDQYQRQARCGYTIAVMAIYWTTEALPIAVTSLAPVVLLPALGVLTAKEVSSVYFNDTTMLFVGGMVAAAAVETWNVHKRIALLVLKLVGAEPKCLLLGICLVTWFLSMWISNTATTAMMIAIVQALLAQFKEMKAHDKTQHVKLNGYSVRAQDKTDQEADAEFVRLSKALTLSVAYSANIGGVASLTGTGPNLVLLAASQKVFEEVGLTSPITFSTWFIYGLPLSLLLMLTMYQWMVVFFLRCKGGCLCCCCSPETKRGQIEKVNAMIRDEYKKLGPVTYAQGSILIAFFLLVVAWVTRDLGGIGGWAALFPKGYLSDSTPSILFGVLMFVLPSSIPKALTNRLDKHATYSRVTPLLTWRQLQDKMPWSLYFLLGGGYAIAHAATVSGLSKWIGDQLMVFRSLDQWLFLLIIGYIVTFATEVTSNTAIATLMMPILAQMSVSLQINPLFFMYPAAVATSFAFMLPVATPPNAIVFSSGTLKVIDMVTSGLFLNIVCVPILILATATWGNAFFHFDKFPREFLQNSTLAGVVKSA
ncbi:Na(+)/citrate cotransporter-like isoform X1 [Biomphalaria glabrata]|uniref:Na(+)/citrate cotransporter-like isoform X1 n=2 Tax=Biomphalaria glabrata TaxID=6526 RepID=A0A9W2YK00_BIOGL|nr:Na(+)/citrate cotransporter-like isoform X1 [Biomphalaria glabrata]